MKLKHVLLGLALLVLTGAGYIAQNATQIPWYLAGFPDVEANSYAVGYDFDNEQTIDAFTGTALSSGTGAVTVDRKFGVYRLSGAATTDNSGFQIQGDMETFSLVAGKKTRYETLLQTSDATESEVLAGLCITDTTLIDAGGTFAVADLTFTDGIGFYKPDGATGFYAFVIRDSTIVASAGPFHTLANDTNVRLGFEVRMDSNTAGKGKALFYINGSLVAGLDSTTMPYDSEEILSPSVAYNTGDNLGTKTCDVDYVRASQDR